jgi:hypothetical protein
MVKASLALPSDSCGMPLDRGGGSGQQIIVRVQASGGKTFKQGTAVASAEIFGCGTRVCGSETDSEAIQIQR